MKNKKKTISASIGHRSVRMVGTGGVIHRFTPLTDDTDHDLSTDKINGLAPHLPV